MLKRFLPLSKFLLVLCAFLLIGSGRIESSDGISALNVARNIIKEGNFTMSPPKWTTGLQTTRGKDGRYYSPTSLGTSLSYLPSVLLTKAIYANQGLDFSKYYPLQPDFLLEFLASFTNPILAFFLFIINYKIFALFTKNKNQAFFLSLVISVATNLFPLAKHSFSHILFALYVMSSFYYLLLHIKQKKSKKNLILSGILFGLAVVSYNVVFTLVFVQLFTALFLLLKVNKRSLRASFKDCVIWALSIAPFILIVLWFNYVRFGSILTTGYDPHTFDLTTKGVLFEGLWGLFLSPGKSIFIYSPILILTTYFAIKHFKTDWSAKLFLSFTSLLALFYSQFVFWNGELSFGPRYMSLIIPFGGIVLARHFKEMTKPKIILVLLIAAGLFIQLEGVVVPYQKQYRIFDFPIIKVPANMTRGEQFAYWSVGEFVPRYSPVYRLIKDIVKDSIKIPVILTSPKHEVHFAKNASLPQKDATGKYYKKLKSVLYLYTKKDLTFKTITFTSPDFPGDVSTPGLCTPQMCYKTNKLVKRNDAVVLDFSPTIHLPANTYFLMVFVRPSKKDTVFEFNTYSFVVGNQPISMHEYSLANLDIHLVRNTILGTIAPSPGLFREANFIHDEVTNTTPDFWWIKTTIYFNEPLAIRAFLYALFIVTFISVVATIVSFKKGYEKS